MTFRHQEEAWPVKGPGVSAKPGPAQAPASSRKPRYRGDPLYAMWQSYIEPACFKRKDTTTSEQMTVFRANIRHLKSKGLEDDDIEELFQLFAEQVRSGKVDVKNKSAWRVFMGSWWKLSANAPTYVPIEGDDGSRYL